MAGWVGTRNKCTSFYELVFFLISTSNMTIQELQTWVADDWKAFPKNKPNIEQQILLILEELGEVAEAIRKEDGRKQRVSYTTDIGSEMADLLVSLVTLANSFAVDLQGEVVAFQERLVKRHQQGF